MVRRQPCPALHDRAGRARRRTGRGRDARRPERAGDERRGLARRHLPGPADQRARRGALRLLRRSATRARGCRHPRGHRHRRPGAHRRCDALARWGVHPGAADQAAVFAPRHVGRLPHVVRDLDPRRSAGPHARRSAHGRHRPDQRRGHRPAWLPLESNRPGNDGVGRGARQGRPQGQRSATRQGRLAGGAVHRRTDRGAAHRVPLHERLVDRAWRHAGHRVGSAHTSRAHVGGRRHGRPARRLRSEHPGSLRRSRPARASAGARCHPAGG